MEKNPTRISIQTAKEVSKKYDYDMVLVIGIRAEDGAGSIATYGKTKELCRHSARYGEAVASAIFGEKI